MSIARIIRIATIGATTLLAGVHGCNDLGMDGPVSPPSLQLAVATPLTVLGKPAHEVLHITSAKLLLRNISFRVSGVEDSLEIVTAPIVVDLDLTAKPRELLMREVSANSYDRMRFTIHRPEDGEPLLDPAFAGGSDSSERFSLVVTGLYHETPFIFRSRESFRIDIDFTSPVAIPVTGSVGVTLTIDPYVWFTEGDLIYDPFNQTEKIDDLIKHAPMRAFRDNDRDGEPDR